MAARRHVWASSLGFDVGGGTSNDKGAAGEISTVGVRNKGVDVGQEKKWFVYLCIINYRTVHDYGEIQDEEVNSLRNRLKVRR